MKHIFCFLGFCLFIACSNDFEIIEEQKDIPVVYGVVSVVDTAHYIRLEKAFVDATTSALELAKNPDNLYYANAAVSINGVQLERVDGNTEGYVREEGIFAQSPNYLYKVDNAVLDLEEGETCNLSIDRQEGDLPVVTANTVVVGEPTFISPNPNGSGIIDFAYFQNTPFSWIGGEGANTFDLFVRFNYLEGDKSGGSLEQKSVLWSVEEGIGNPDGRVRKEVMGLEFYSFISGAIEIDENKERFFTDLEILMISGGKEIAEYVRVGEANLGITSSQDVPTFSNLSEGRGIFSSKHEISIPNITLSRKSQDSLIMGFVTEKLNFQ